MKDGDYEIARNHNYDGYQTALASIVYKGFDKKTWSGVSVNEQLAEQLHKPVSKKIKRRNFYARFKDNIWVADLTKMESLFSENKNVKCLLCAMDVSTKNTIIIIIILLINDRVKIMKYKNILSKGYTDNWLKEIFIIDSVLKTNPWSYKIKDLSREKK